MWRLLRDLKAEGKEEIRLRLLRLLASDLYAPDSLFGSNEGFRYSYAESLAESGGAAGARPILAQIRNASLLARASLDPRLRTLLPAGVDIRAAAEAQLAADKEIMARHPDRLDAVNNDAPGT